MAFIIVCKHCGDKCSGDYCVKCNSLEKRIEVDRANTENFRKNGMELESPCPKCQAEIEKIKNKK